MFKDESFGAIPQSALLPNEIAVRVVTQAHIDSLASHLKSADSDGWLGSIPPAVFLTVFAGLPVYPYGNDVSQVVEAIGKFPPTMAVLSMRERLSQTTSLERLRQILPQVEAYRQMGVLQEIVDQVGQTRFFRDELSFSASCAFPVIPDPDVTDKLRQSIDPDLSYGRSLDGQTGIISGVRKGQWRQISVLMGMRGVGDGACNTLTEAIRPLADSILLLGRERGLVGDQAESLGSWQGQQSPELRNELTRIGRHVQEGQDSLDSVYAHRLFNACQDVRDDPYLFSEEIIADGSNHPHAVVITTGSPRATDGNVRSMLREFAAMYQRAKRADTAGAINHLATALSGLSAPLVLDIALDSQPSAASGSDEKVGQSKVRFDRITIADVPAVIASASAHLPIRRADSQSPDVLDVSLRFVHLPSYLEWTKRQSERDKAPSFAPWVSRLPEVVEAVQDSHTRRLRAVEGIPPGIFPSW